MRARRATHWRPEPHPRALTRASAAPTSCRGSSTASRCSRTSPPRPRPSSPRCSRAAPSPAARPRGRPSCLEFVGHGRLRRRPATDLSYGQRKLVELAQVLMLDPAVILLDEPAAGINPTLLRRLSDLIVALNQAGRTFVIVEHDMHFVLSLADSAVVLAARAGDRRRRPGDRQRRPSGARGLPRRRLRPEAQPVVGGAVMIELRGVHRRLRRAATSCRASTSSSRSGSITCIVGPNGAGQVDRAAHRSAGCCAARRGEVLLDGRRDPVAVPGRGHRRRGGPGARSRAACSATSRCATTCSSAAT